MILALTSGCSLVKQENQDDGDINQASEKTEASGESPNFPQSISPNQPIVRPDAVPEDLGVIWESWSYLLRDYVDPTQLKGEEFSERAIRAMLTVLGDPQTSYLSPSILQGSFQDVFRGNFEGIGAHVNMNRQCKLVIISPIPGGPAEKAGIKPGDIILEADGENLEGLSLLEAVSKIRGPKGSTVKLLVKHLGALDPVLIEIIRDKIPLISVHLRSQPGDRFAHIRISQFYPNTPDALKDMVLKAIEDGSEGIILDLRNNDGGTLDSVINIASLFLRKNDDLVLYVEKGDGSRTNWQVRHELTIADEIPLVMLINERSASSSEVLAGALQDHERATIIGEISFGKGSVNILRPLSNGGGLYITIAHWHTPNGRQIHGKGITPDIEITHRDSREKDVLQLKAAINELERILDSS